MAHHQASKNQIKKALIEKAGKKSKLKTKTGKEVHSPSKKQLLDYAKKKI